MSDEKVKIKIYNCIILGPSSSGKTTIAHYLANKYNGERISLDGNTASGRPINTIIPMNHSTQFTSDEIGVLIRRIMIKEARAATRINKPWFIDDIDTYVYEILPKILHDKTKVVIVIPTIDRIIKNVTKRNKEANIASEERKIINVLKQLKNFITPYLLSSQEAKKLIEKKSHYVISNQELISACIHDKMHYSISERKNWEDDVNDILTRFGFKPLKSKKLQYAELRPVNYGQHAVFLNNGSFQPLFKKIETFLQVNHYD